MRFTLDFSHHPWTRGEATTAARHTLAVAQAADAGGIDAIWVSEDPEGWDAFAVLGAIAAVTQSAALGTSVTSPYPRHPNLLAASVATLDRLSGRRAVLGLGRGQPEWHRDALGIDIGDPLPVLRETVGLLRDWWAAPHRASSPDDGHFGVDDWERIISPVQERVPILLAAAGPRALDLAGEICDGVIFNRLTSHEVLRETIPRVRSRTEAAGRSADRLWFVLQSPVTIVDSPEGERTALDRGKHHLALVSTLPGMDRLSRVEGFDVPALLNDVRTTMRVEETLAAGGGFPALRRAGDLAAAREMIPDELIRRLGIVGPLPEVRERLRSLEALGVTHVGVSPPRDPVSAESWRGLLEDLSD